MTRLTPCRVPWSVSPSMGAVTLLHTETDVEPECSVVFGGGRLGDDDRTDSRRIEITFSACYHARVGPHSDRETIEAIGYSIESSFQGDIDDYLDWRRSTWRATGLCPDPSFYVARESDWLSTLPSFERRECRHYVVDGSNGYVELIASRFAWREWSWIGGHRDAAPDNGPVIGRGEGID